MKHVRCPACQTLFRVTGEQLEARGGRVRCGQCAHVFNALEQDAEADHHEAPEAVEQEHWPDVPGLHRAAHEPASPPAAEEAGGTAPATAEREGIPDAAPEAPSGWSDDRPDLQLPPPPGQGGHGWLLAFALLLLAAALESVWVFRAELAMAVPELRPRLVTACDALGCDLPLPREASQIGIEGSELRPAPQGGSLLRLGATLRNRAGYAQAYPHLELTLTDTDDKVLARRVVAPAEYLAPKANPAAGFPGGSDLPVTLTLDPTSLSPAGYRLYIFYP